MGHGKGERNGKRLTRVFACYINALNNLTSAAVSIDEIPKSVRGSHDKAGRAGAAARVLLGPLVTVLFFFLSPQSLMTISHGTQSQRRCAACLIAGGNSTRPDARSTASTGTEKVRRGTASGTTALGITKAPRAIRDESEPERRPSREVPILLGGEARSPDVDEAWGDSRVA